jgi:hypothetical protein
VVSHQSSMAAGGRDVALNLFFEKCVAGKGLTGAIFGCVAGKGLRGADFGCVAGKGVSDPSTLLRVNPSTLLRASQRAESSEQEGIEVRGGGCIRSWRAILTRHSNRSVT